jgi:hypothetical protein
MTGSDELIFATSRIRPIIVRTSPLSFAISIVSRMNFAIRGNCYERYCLVFFIFHYQKELTVLGVLRTLPRKPLIKASA